MFFFVTFRVVDICFQRKKKLAFFQSNLIWVGAGAGLGLGLALGF